jgi:hypothetical protein
MEPKRTVIGPELSWTFIVSPSMTLVTVPTRTGFFLADGRNSKTDQQ